MSGSISGAWFCWNAAAQFLTRAKFINRMQFVRIAILQFVVQIARTIDRREAKTERARARAH